FGCPAHDVERNVAQAVGVADRDPALQAEGSGAGGNLLELEYAEQPRTVEVNVDGDAAPIGNSEADVELPLDVAIHAGGVDAADAIGASLDGRVQQGIGSRAGDDTALGERHPLHGHRVTVAFAHREQGFEMPQTDDGVHVDVAADDGRAVRDGEFHERGGAVVHRRGPGQQFLLEGEALADVEA